MSFTFTEADTEKDFATLDPGNYSAEIDKVSETKNGSLMLVFKSSESGDRLCNDFLSFSEKAKGITAKKLKLLGLEKVDGQYHLSDDGQELVGKRVSLTLVHDNDPKYLTPDFNSDGFGYAVDDIDF